MVAEHCILVYCWFLVSGSASDKLLRLWILLRILQAGMSLQWDRLERNPPSVSYISHSSIGPCDDWSYA
jgi:hypothetical protein